MWCWTLSCMIYRFLLAIKWQFDNSATHKEQLMRSSPLLWPLCMKGLSSCKEVRGSRGRNSIAKFRIPMQNVTRKSENWCGIYWKLRIQVSIWLIRGRRAFAKEAKVRKPMKGGNEGAKANEEAVLHNETQIETQKRSIRRGQIWRPFCLGGRKPGLIDYDTQPWAQVMGSVSRWVQVEKPKGRIRMNPFNIYHKKHVCVCKCCFLCIKWQRMIMLLTCWTLSI